MKRVACLLLFVSNAVLAVNDPFLVESKVQMDLDAALARIIPREQFLVLTSAEVTTRREHELVEGETTELQPQSDGPQTPAAPAPIKPKPMPGFVLEPDEAPPAPPSPRPLWHPKEQRRYYRLAESPELSLIRVAVSLDETLPPRTIALTKVLVRNYLLANFPGRSRLSFGLLPMLKAPAVEKPKAEDKAGEKTRPASKEASHEKRPEAPAAKTRGPVPVDVKAWRVGRWLALGLLFIASILLWRVGASIRDGAREGAFRAFTATDGGEAERPARALSTARSVARDEARDEPWDEQDERLHLAEIRRRLLGRFLSRSRILRSYFLRLSKESRAQLHFAMRGAAFDSLLDGLGLQIPGTPEAEPADHQACLLAHEKDFAEFSDAKDWEGRQMFGFLRELSDEQLVSLARQQRPLSVCAILRFMKAGQSASVLEALPSAQRVEVLREIPNLERTSLTEIAGIEKEVRAAVSQIPSQGYGSTKGDLEFWGSVLSEASDQEAILEEMERTNPELYPDLKRYKFNLEDAATLPNSLIEKVFADVDNDELGAALSTCPAHVAEVLMDAVPTRRREFLLNQMRTFKSAPVDVTRAARTALVKRFRQVMA